MARKQGKVKETFVKTNPEGSPVTRPRNESVSFKSYFQSCACFCADCGRGSRSRAYHCVFCDRGLRSRAYACFFFLRSRVTFARILAHVLCAYFTMARVHTCASTLRVLHHGTHFCAHTCACTLRILLGVQSTRKVLAKYSQKYT